MFKVEPPSMIFSLILILVTYVVAYGSSIIYNEKRGLLGGFGIRKRLRNIPWKNGLPFLSYREYYKDNDAFLNEGFKRLGDIFAFRFMSRNVVAISNNEEALKVFFHHKDLNLSSAWGTLRGDGIFLSQVKKVKIPNWPQKADMIPYVKRATKLFKKERLDKCIPLMFKDLMPYVESWGEKGRFNPWDEYFTASMQLLLHVTSFRELASSPVTVKRIADLFRELEETRSFGATYLPRLSYISLYFPLLTYMTGGIIGGGHALKRKIAITKELFRLMKPIMDERYAKRKMTINGKYNSEQIDMERVDDQMQVLIDEGDHPMSLIQFMMTSLFSGMLNTFKTASWVTAYILSNPKYKALIRAEVESVVNTLLPSTSNEAVVTRLSEIPLEIWESHMPVLDSCIRETIRLTLNGAASRKNKGDKSIILPGVNGAEDVEVKPGECIVMSGKMMHMDERLYPDPMRWDPSRYERGEDKSHQFAYLGWGAGRHLCLGKRLAELETKMIISSIFMKYPNCSLELEDGTPIDCMEKLPAMDTSSTVLVLPMKPIYVRCVDETSP